MASTDFVVTYQSWAALRRDARNQLAHNGLFVRTDRQSGQFEPVAIRLVLPSGEEIELPGQVLQAMPGQGLAIQFDNTAVDGLSHINLACSQNDDPLPVEAGPDDPAISTPLDDMPLAEGDPQDPAGRSRQIESMSVAEKRRTALHGRKDERLLLMRDRNKTIHPFVLKNPGITLDEVEQFARMPAVNPDALRMMAKHPDWTRSASVCRNLVRNPKTPLREALALLDKLPKAELRALAKSSNVRTAVQQAARRKVVG